MSVLVAMESEVEDSADEQKRWVVICCSLVSCQRRLGAGHSGRTCDGTANRTTTAGGDVGNRESNAKAAFSEPAPQKAGSNGVSVPSVTQDAASGAIPSSATSPVEQERTLTRPSFDAGDGVSVLTQTDASSSLSLSAMGESMPNDGEHASAALISARLLTLPSVESENEALRRELRELEEMVATKTAELRAALQQAEEANASKTRFLAVLSHELRTPLACITGATHLLLQEDIAGRQRDQIRRIDAAARHVAGVVNNVLDVAKIEIGVFELDEKDFSLEEVLQNVELQIAYTLRAKGLRFEVVVENVPPYVHGDPTRLAQALLNYLSNAAKFTPSGSVTLRARGLPACEHHAPVLFEVEDTGAGIATADQSRLFKSFSQADETISRRLGGTGLGLAINRRIAQLMGGEVGLQSELGRGSTFWMTARFKRASPKIEADAVDTLATLRAEFSGVRVLLADDDVVGRTITRLMLERAGLVVEEAADGVAAVAAAKAQDFGLLLLDLQMPLLDGVAAARAIREMPGRALVPIVALTAQAFGDDRSECLAAGMNEHLAKPVPPELLYGTVLAWLRA
jgi:two-component system sensor histidine kinase/response regulator